MEKSSASGGGRGKNKRFWTSEEDKALMAALHELSSDPHWKCEKEFRNGYMIHLEEVISKAMPGCGLKAKPHIDSRLKTLMSKYRAILAMLEISGSKWDDERQMILVEQSVYEEYCKVRPIYPTAKNLYGVPFPHLHLMMEIYGKDLLKGFKRLWTKFMKDMNVHLSTMANVWAGADGREQDLSDKCNNVLSELLQPDGIAPGQGEAFEAANILSAQPNKPTIIVLVT
ncbi:Polyprotein P3 [Bienertia sinuspersici]